MSLTPTTLAEAAQGLVGAPFRLHGRDPATGLDCVGVLAAALHACGVNVELPSGYRLRMGSIDAWLPAPDSLGFAASTGPVEPGDVVMQKLGAAQFHLAIAVDDAAWIHAHAGLRRVVRTSALPQGPVVHHWRASPTT